MPTRVRFDTFVAGYFTCLLVCIVGFFIFGAPLLECQPEPEAMVATVEAVEETVKGDEVPRIESTVKGYEVPQSKYPILSGPASVISTLCGRLRLRHCW
jgi:hypothetical protein